ncbi:VOC family protein [Streptomyces thermocarboxydus]
MRRTRETRRVLQGVAGGGACRRDRQPGGAPLRRRLPPGPAPRHERDRAELAAPGELLQAHLEFVAEDLDGVERKIVSLGGRPTESGDAAGAAEERGYADPAGHSFTVRRGVPMAPKQG